MLGEWTDVLLLHLIRDAPTIERLQGKLEPGDIADFTMDSNRGFLWKCSRDYFEKTGVPIPQHFLIAEITDKIMQDGDMHPDALDVLGKFIDFVYKVADTGFNYEIALKYAQRLLENVRVNAPIQEMFQDGADVGSIFDKFQTGLSAASISSARPINPMANWENMLGTVKPEPMGGPEVEYFNTLVNGGLVPGEIVVLMGPMGGFKTTIAIDLVCSIAEVERKHCMFMSYEQSYQGGDLPIRFMSRMSGIGRTLLMNNSIHDMLPDQIKAMNAAKEYSSYVKMYDRSQHGDKVSDIAALVRDLIADGQKPRVVVIDQLMTWMQQWPEAANAQDDWFRKESTKVIKTLKSQVCEKYGVCVLVLHQITAGKISGKKGKSFSHTDSAENKSIGFWADFVITIGTKDEDIIFPMEGGKTRRGENTKVVVQALPEICQFKSISDRYMISDKGNVEQKGRGNVRVAHDDNNNPPTMRKSQAVE